MFEDDNIGRSRMLPPLPERMRPHDLDGYVGQKHLIGKGGIIRNMINNGNLSSFILWYIGEKVNKTAGNCKIPGGVEERLTAMS